MSHGAWNIPESAKSQVSILQDDDRTFRVRTILAVSAGGLLGLVGNGLLLCFYGNKQTRTYRSRDAIYIRRQAYADLLICTIVIPYSVLFESDLITNDYVCKSMEFVRHFLVYMSHLLLYTYCWELPRRHMYSASQTFNLNTIFYSTVMSVLAAAPTFFIFRVDRIKPVGIQEPQSEKVVHPNSSSGSRSHHSGQHKDIPSCRINTNLVVTRDEFDVKSLTWVYAIIPIVLYSMSLYWFLMNLTSYLNTFDVTSRKESLFLTKLEDIRLFRTSTTSSVLTSLGAGSRGKTSQEVPVQGRNNQVFLVIQRQVPRRDTRGAAIADDFGAECDDDDDDDDDDRLKQRKLSLSSRNNNSRTGFDKDVATSMMLSGEGKPILLLREPASTSTSSLTVSSADVDRPRSPSVSAAARRKFKKTRFKNNIQIVGSPQNSQRLHHRRGTGLPPPNKVMAHVGRMSYTSKETSSDGQTRNIEVEFDSNSTRKRFRPILKYNVPGYYPRVGSYKKSLATLIFLDFIAVLVATTAYLVSGGASVVLTMVHLKSILSFYILSLLNPYLRHCVYGREHCVCLPPASDSRKPSRQSGRGSMSMRPSVLQVSFVRERNKQKGIARAARKQRYLQLARAQFGTDIY